ncbi:hypothetical protein VB779_15230 [Haloarculaceae archaeon H-GB11]|nr:hypothetical protein [Haloarculaceae archaeon H-GB11]
MDAATLQEAVHEEMATEIDRLGSDKALFSVTGGTLEEAEILGSLAADDAAVRDVVRSWADDEADSTAREAFAEAADRLDEQVDRLAADLDGDLPGAEDAVADHLGTLTETEARVAAGLVARPLVRDRTLLQVVNYFVNEADRQGADLARELRSATDEGRAAGLETLDACCETEAEYERAHEAATELVAVAYRDYADALESLGLDPKPIC